jgi:uncharacterized protein GlcG (DUF336 family)
MKRFHAACLIALVVLGACDNDSARDVADRTQRAGLCSVLPSQEELKRYLEDAPDSIEAGGLFHGQHQWGALVDRQGRICAVVEADDTAGASWPGSRHIAMAKAYTANAFSTDAAAMSTARLYSDAQPGGSLYGAAVANPFSPECLGERKGIGKVCGGTIVFGGGLALYNEQGQVIGGLGTSGDTPCADHEIAKVIRAMARLAPPGGNTIDDIVYAVGEPASAYTHPVCVNTYRNGVAIGSPPPRPSYGFVPAPSRPDSVLIDSLRTGAVVADTVQPITTGLDTAEAQ